MSHQDSALRSDPSEHRLAELEIRLAAAEEEAERLRLGADTSHDLFDKSPLCSFVVDQEGRIVRVNPACLRLFGCDSADEILGRDTFDFIHPDSRPLIRRRIQEHRKGDKSPHFNESRRLRCDGSDYYAEIAASPMEWQGRFAVLLVVRDITHRKQAERAIEQGKMGYQSLIDILPASIAYLDYDLRIGFANREICKNLEIAPEEIIGKPIHEICDAQEFAQNKTYYEQVLAGHKIEFDRIIRQRNGRETHWHTTFIPHFDSSGRVVGLISMDVDISGRKRIENALRESEERNRVLIDAFPDAVFIHQDDTIVFVNPAAVTLYAAESASDLVGLKAVELVHPDDRPAVRERHREIAEKGHALDIREFRRLRRDGSEFCGESIAVPFVWNGRPAVLVVARDVSRRKRAEEQLITAQKRLEDAVEGVSGGIVLWDAQNRLVMCNGQYRDFFPEISHLMVPGLPHETMMKAIVDAGLIRNWGEDLNAEFAYREMLRHDYGQTIERELTNGRWMQIQDRETSEGGTVGLRTDITELKRSQLDALTLREEAEAANNAKSGFLANMSHELRTPLNAILGFSEVMRQEMFGPLGSGRYREYLNDIRHSGQHLLGIIDDILDLSKIEAGKMDIHDDEFDPAEVVESSARLVEERAKRQRIEVKLLIDDHRPRLRADCRKFTQILLNLLSNAIKFTSANGTITVSAGVEAGGYRVSVQDTGIGMAEIEIRTALAPFGQVDNNQKYDQAGTGLGLPLAKSLTEMHGGRFSVESTPGVGSVFTFRFPADRLVDPD